MQKITLLLAALLLSLIACNSKPKEGVSTFYEPIGKKVDTSTSATISGVVKFEGTPPKPQKIDMGQDPSCGTQPNYDESYVVNNGDLANVFVYVKSASGSSNIGGSIRVKTSPDIEQRGCRYHPHVLGVMAGDPVNIVNA